MLRLPPFPGLRVGAGGLELKKLGLTALRWGGDGLAGTCDSQTSTSSQISGKMWDELRAGK